MVFEECPITSKIHERRREIIRNNFRALDNCEHKNFLSLWRYLDHSPEEFFSVDAAIDHFNFFEIVIKNDPDLIPKLLSSSTNNLLNIAFKGLAETNPLGIHEELLPSDDYELMLWIDRHIHPNYLKLVETVFANLILPVCIYVDIKTELGIKRWDIYERTKALEKTDLTYLLEPYERIIRNAIAHGKIIYKHKEIIYQDRTKKLAQSPHNTVKMFDDMLDICNGLALGMSLFFLTNTPFRENTNVVIPQALMLEELISSTEAPGWKVLGCLESEITGNRTQLLIFTRDRILDGWKTRYHTFRTAVLAEKLAPGYDRYFVSLKSKFGKLGETGFAPFIGSELRRLRIEGAAAIEDYGSVLEDGLFFHFPKIKLPRFIFKISNILTGLKISYGLWKEEMKEYFQVFDLSLRYVKLHRTAYYSVIKGSLVITPKKSIPVETIIRKYAKRILRKTVRKARKESKFLSLGKYLPVGYIRVAIFSKDFRLRRIKSPGLIPELLCTLEIKKVKRIQVPDIYSGIPEKANNIKLVWNKNAGIFGE